MGQEADHMISNEKKTAETLVPKPLALRCIVKWEGEHERHHGGTRRVETNYWGLRFTRDSFFPLPNGKSGTFYAKPLTPSDQSG